jgi:hypothetical protein
MRPETFGVFAVKVVKYGNLETDSQLAKARYWRAFLQLSGWFRGRPDCLADLGGFEPPHSQKKKGL